MRSRKKLCQKILIMAKFTCTCSSKGLTPYNSSTRNVLLLSALTGEAEAELKRLDQEKKKRERERLAQVQS